MRDHQGALLREVAVQLVHDLHCHVRLARARRSHHHGQPRVHSRANGFHLRGREAHRVQARLVLLVGSRDRRDHRLHQQRLLRRHVSARLVGARHVSARPFALALLARGCHLGSGRGEGDLERRLEFGVPHKLDGLVGEALLEVLLVDERVLERHRLQPPRHLRVVRRRRVPVAEEDVVQPLWHRALFVHEVTYALEDGFEVVLLGLAAHHHVHRLVHVLRARRHAGVGVQLVLRCVQRDGDCAQAASWRALLVRPHAAREVVHQLALLIAHLHQFAAADVLQPGSLLRRARFVTFQDVLGRHHAQQEEHVVLLELVPLEARLPEQSAGVNHDVGQHLRGLGLAHLRLADFSHRERFGGQRHACPALEANSVWRVVVALHKHRLDAPEHIAHVLADFVGGLQAEEVEVAQEVVVERQKLHVELGQRQHALPGVVDAGHHVLVPQHRLRRVERQLVHRLPLGRLALVGGDEHLLQAVQPLGPRVLRRQQPQLLRCQLVQFVGVQHVEVLLEGGALLQGAHGGERQLHQLWDVPERQALQLLHPLGVHEVHLLVRQVRPRVVVDLEALVEHEEVGELAEEAAAGVRMDRGEAALGEHGGVLQEGAHETARWQLREQIAQQLQEPLSVQQHARVHVVRGARLLRRHNRHLQELEELAHHGRDEPRLGAVLRRRVARQLGRLGLLLLQVPPVLLERRVVFEFELQPPRR
mmetsp:Transcript_13354/g.25631  ORF Transcript_13354/g.25631 Transcript_13354/m.25631 type:complete len:705 (+) Transcript_13354:2030-4144(+)